MLIMVTILLLMLCSSAGTDGQPWGYTAENKALEFGSVPASNYVTQVYYDPGLEGILFQLARTFLHVVQPNPFPQGKYDYQINTLCRNLYRLSCLNIL